MSLQEINRNIEKFSKKLDVDITKGLEVVGQHSVAVIKKNTPVVDGRLRNSMSYTIAGRVVAPEAPHQADDVLLPNKKTKELVVGTNVIYAPPVEFLSKTGSAGFMNRSFNQIKATTKKTLATALKRVIK